jgi:hypothetical protein
MSIEEERPATPAPPIDPDHIRPIGEIQSLNRNEGRVTLESLQVGNELVNNQPQRLKRVREKGLDRTLMAGDAFDLDQTLGESNNLGSVVLDSASDAVLQFGRDHRFSLSSSFLNAFRQARTAILRKERRYTCNVAATGKIGYL